ncbi:MAG: hypothetical protein M1587_04565 [Thaumarchaeota archaeon]|nr:hypothetical protein [Nitrososphaerota archaeon]
MVSGATLAVFSPKNIARPLSSITKRGVGASFAGFGIFAWFLPQLMTLD